MALWRVQLQSLQVPVVDNIVAFDAITHSAYGLDIRAMPGNCKAQHCKIFSFSFAKSILINLHQNQNLDDVGTK